LDDAEKALITSVVMRLTGSLNLDNLNGATKTRMRIIRGEMIAAGMNVT
jgi:hypothetical protein